MSADNGIYIMKFLDGYRVCHGMAIERLTFYKEGTPEWVEEHRAYFGKSEVYLTKEDAILKAHEMANDYPILEYGVCYSGEVNIDLSKKSNTIFKGKFQAIKDWCKKHEILWTNLKLGGNIERTIYVADGVEFNDLDDRPIKYVCMECNNMLSHRGNTLGCTHCNKGWALVPISYKIVEF